MSLALRRSAITITVHVRNLCFLGVPEQFSSEGLHDLDSALFEGGREGGRVCMI